MKEGNADDIKYAEDKPQDCRFCYFWNSLKQACRKERCYYKRQEKKPVVRDIMLGDCHFCPYGRYSPCLGYCLEKIILELHPNRQREGDRTCRMK